MSHFRFESLSNDWSVPKEARPKVAKPKGHVDDSHVTDYSMPNASPTPPHFLNNGQPYGDVGGQLEVRNSAALKDALEIAAAPLGTRKGLIRAWFANYGCLGDGSGPDQGTRPAYSRDQEAAVMGEGYSEDDMNQMSLVDHVGWMSTALDAISGCPDCDDASCAECRSNYAKHKAHQSRFEEKRDAGDGDGDEDDDSAARLDDAKRTYEEKPNSAELEAAAVSIARHVRKAGESHLAPMPRRGK